MPNEDLIKEFAYRAYQIRIKCGLPGDEKTDWFDGLKMYRDYQTLQDKLKNMLPNKRVELEEAFNG